jgi:acetyl-CoA carboxylase carboxyl transferase subunit beta
MLFRKELDRNYRVCHHCDHHLRMDVEARLDMLFDDGRYKTIDLPETPDDPLRFKDRKKYYDRLKSSRKKTDRDDAIVVAQGHIHGIKTVIAAFDFSFMGGSMGMAVGNGILAAAERAVAEECAMIAIPSSGGARMQEGALSLMQMPRTIIAVNKLREAGLPYIVILADPTTGGVSASFAMMGDIHIAEPGAQIGFAGKRVIKETIREDLPDGFQTAEYLFDHGMVDMVVDRDEQRATLAQMISILQKGPAPTPADQNKINNESE